MCREWGESGGLEKGRSFCTHSDECQMKSAGSRIRGWEEGREHARPEPPLQGSSYLGSHSPLPGAAATWLRAGARVP